MVERLCWGCRLWNSTRLVRLPLSGLLFCLGAVERPHSFLHLKANLAHASEYFSTFSVFVCFFKFKSTIMLVVCLNLYLELVTNGNIVLPRRGRVFVFVYVNRIFLRPRISFLNIKKNNDNEQQNVCVYINYDCVTKTILIINR